MKHIEALTQKKIKLRNIDLIMFLFYLLELSEYSVDIRLNLNYISNHIIKKRLKDGFI